jgi:hypothetical protein
MEELGHAVSGGLSAVISTTFLHPLEALRTKMQALTHSISIRELVE